MICYSLPLVIRPITPICLCLLIFACDSQETTGLGDTGVPKDLGVQPDMGPKPDMGGQPDMMVMGRVPENHRPQAIDCDMERPRPPVNVNGPADCNSHEDCTAGLNGRCSDFGRHHSCTYDACFSDSDCGSGVCGCGVNARTDANSCMSGNCRVNADCGAGGYCSPSFGECGPFLGPVAYYCHTAQDECIDDRDCPDANGRPGYCAYNELARRWQCENSLCAG